MPNSIRDQRSGDVYQPGERGHEPCEPRVASHAETDARQRQIAMLAERDPTTVASALAGFRKRRGFERSGLAAWLRLPPDRLVALTLEPRPLPTDPGYECAVAGLAARYGADPTRLAEAIAG